MAGAQSRTHTWSVPTSPRSPEKLPDELALLSRFEGQLWNEDTQTRFARALAEAEFFEGSVSATEPDFSARDRVNRAPKTFGFVRIQRGTPLEITPAGRELIGRRNVDDLLLRQLLKWQYPSANHGGRDYRELFCIRPFLEVLRLVRDLGGLTKTELAIFAVPLIRYEDYEDVTASIRAYRAALSRVRGNAARKQFARDALRRRIREIYDADIRAGRIARAKPPRVKLPWTGSSARRPATSAITPAPRCGTSGRPVYSPFPRGSTSWSCSRSDLRRLPTSSKKPRANRPTTPMPLRFWRPSATRRSLASPATS
ncbi:MAG: AlwI family type II restriction endonuclease [Armatimonadetes bacterium]|nr:AlwI family type II restriction endonuclease [Armatimonadota bacterium]